MRLPLLAAPLLLAACVPAPRPQPADAAAPAFPVIRFFEGRTEGRGLLRIAFKSPRPISVESRGYVKSGRRLAVHQTIVEGNKPARTREWEISQVSPGRYSGRLSDAAGPVSGEVTHNRLHLSFRMKGGLHAQQWLTMEPGGRSVRNVMVVRKFGIPVASLEETIRKLD